MNTFLEQLRIVRATPRRMHKSYLEKHNLYTYIQEQVPNDFSIKEKIDVILNNHTAKCYCGNLSKPSSKWCSIVCRNKDTTIRQNISTKNTANSVDRLDKAKQTRIARYGVSAVQDIPASKIKTRETKQAYYDSVIDDTFDRYSIDRTLLSDHAYLKSICDNSTLFEVQREHFGSMHITTLCRYFERIGFDPGFKKGSTSNGEQEMYKWICSILPDEYIRNNDRKTLGKELDIYIPARNLAIEYHGLYWHAQETLSKKGHSKYYHLEKMDLANAANINLLQIFEDEWLYKKEIVKSIIKAKLGIFDTIVYGRKTTIQPVSKKDSDLFLDDNHLQGKCIGKSFGLYSNEELVCMITVGKSRFDSSHEIYRFASKIGHKIIGGFSKLLVVAKEHLGVEQLSTYADMRYSNGETYKKFGEFVRTTNPGYFWVNPSKNIRINRFSTMKHKLAKLLGAKFDPTKTENYNMENAGYLKIYDCGNHLYLV